MSEVDKNSLLEEEVLIVRFSGEIPEVAYHGSIYYLTEDEEGPGIELDDEDHALLQQAVVDRYHEIILRDLTPDNRDLGLYRGIARSSVNWQRLCKFCRKTGLPFEDRLRQKVADAFLAFMKKEFDDVSSGSRKACINCSASSLQEFAASLKVDCESMPAGWQELCCE
jgi:hypothetical protein